MIKMQYLAKFIRNGFAIIEANSEDEAWEIASSYSMEDVTWSDCFDLCDEGIEEDCLE